MSKPDDLSRLRRRPIVAILRASDGGLLAEAAEALAAGGIEAIEVTFTVPAAHRVIEDVAGRLGERILLGAGTVLDAETARIALLSGARFLVSPAVNAEVIATARRYGALAMPGAFTPSEILAAHQAGADVVKVFPSDFVGPGYLKVIAGPLPNIRLMPTGGVNLETIARFFDAGAFAVGVGTSLVESASLAKRDFAGIEAKARAFVAALPLRD